MPFNVFHQVASLRMLTVYVMETHTYDNSINTQHTCNTPNMILVLPVSIMYRSLEFVCPTCEKEERERERKTQNQNGQEKRVI